VVCGSAPEVSECTTSLTAAALIKRGRVTTRKRLGPARRLRLVRGRDGRPSFRMSRAGTALLRRRGKLRVRLTLVATTVGAAHATRVLTVTLAYPRSRLGSS
jgi:hypothetical protein